MERRDDFDAVCADVGNAISEALARHNLDPFDALALCAVVEAMASPFKLHHLRGTRLTREVGRFGQKAYNASCLARSIEEIKSPDSLVVNPMMDAIAGALADKGSIADAELPARTVEFLEDLPKYADWEAIEEAESLVSRIPGPPFQSARQHLTEGGAFGSALRYLEEAGIVRFSKEESNWCLTGYPAIEVDC